MAKATKRWAFRYPHEHHRGGLYVIWCGVKPRKRKGKLPNISRHETFDKARTNWTLPEREFEAIFPIRLKPGEGPVEIRFADEE